VRMDVETEMKGYISALNLKPRERVKPNKPDILLASLESRHE
jgi:hypothetical protein